MPETSEPASGSVMPRQEIFSPGDRGHEVALLLLLGAEQVDRRGRHVRVDRDAHGQAAGVRVHELLGEDEVAEVVAALAAVLLGVGEPEQPELAHARGTPSRGTSSRSHSSAWGLSSLTTKAWIDSRSRSCSSVKMKCRRLAAKSGLRTSAAGVLMKVDSRTSHFRSQPRRPDRRRAARRRPVGPCGVRRGLLLLLLRGRAPAPSGRAVNAVPAESLPVTLMVSRWDPLRLSALNADFRSLTLTVLALPAAIVKRLAPHTLVLFRSSCTLPLQVAPASPSQAMRTFTRPLRSARSFLPTLILALAAGSCRRGRTRAGVAAALALTSRPGASGRAS